MALSPIKSHSKGHCLIMIQLSVRIRKIKDQSERLTSPPFKMINPMEPIKCLNWSSPKIMETKDPCTQVLPGPKMTQSRKDKLFILQNLALKE